MGPGVSGVTGKPCFRLPLGGLMFLLQLVGLVARMSATWAQAR